MQEKTDLQQLQEAFAAMQIRLEAQEVEILRLKANQTTVAEPTQPPQTTTRRRALKKLAAATAGFAALGTVATATQVQPTSADTNGSLLIGTNNNPTNVADTTTLGLLPNSGNNRAPVLFWVNNSTNSGSPLPNNSSFKVAIAGVTDTPTALGIGVLGKGDYAGVRGESSSYGVEGIATNNPIQSVGVIGRSTSTNGAIGVGGEALTGIGVYGMGGFGVYGQTGLNTAGTGVVGRGLTPGSCGGAFEGTKIPLQLVPNTNPTPGPPQASAGACTKGMFYVDINGSLFYCYADGTPGSWRELVNANPTDQLHFITPTRLVDTLNGTAANPIGAISGYGSITPPGTAAYIDAFRKTFTITGSTVPSNAKAITGYLYVNPNSTHLTVSPGYGNLSLWQEGTAIPLPSASAVKGFPTCVFAKGVTTSTLFTVPLSATGKFYAASDVNLDLVIDVIGYYA